jgi:hypothetical protein
LITSFFRPVLQEEKSMGSALSSTARTATCNNADASSSFKQSVMEVPDKGKIPPKQPVLEKSNRHEKSQSSLVSDKSERSQKHSIHDKSKIPIRQPVSETTKASLKQTVSDKSIVTKKHSIHDKSKILQKQPVSETTMASLKQTVSDKPIVTKKHSIHGKSKILQKQPVSETTIKQTVSDKSIATKKHYIHDKSKISPNQTTVEKAKSSLKQTVPDKTKIIQKQKIMEKSKQTVHKRSKPSSKEQVKISNRNNNGTSLEGDIPSLGHNNSNRREVENDTHFPASPSQSVSDEKLSSLKLQSDLSVGPPSSPMVSKTSNASRGNLTETERALLRQWLIGKFYTINPLMENFSVNSRFSIFIILSLLSFFGSVALLIENYIVNSIFSSLSCCFVFLALSH